MRGGSVAIVWTVAILSIAMPVQAQLEPDEHSMNNGAGYTLVSFGIDPSVWLDDQGRATVTLEVQSFVTCDDDRDLPSERTGRISLSSALTTNAEEEFVVPWTTHRGFDNSVDLRGILTRPIELQGPVPGEHNETRAFSVFASVNGGSDGRVCTAHGAGFNIARTNVAVLSRGRSAEPLDAETQGAGNTTRGTQVAPLVAFAGGTAVGIASTYVWFGRLRPPSRR